MTFLVISSNLLVLLSSLLAVLSLFYVFDKFLVPSAKEVTNINSYLPQLYHDRRQHVKDVCDRYRKRLEQDFKKFQPSKNYQNVVSEVDLLYSTNKKPFLWCRVRKASSQSWNDLFVSLWYRNYTKDEPGKQQMFIRRDWTPQTRNTQFYYGANDKIFSFMVSRHPFERILSAYRDKFFVNQAYSKAAFERRKVQRFQKLYGREILKNYRRNSPQEEKYKDAPTFREFVDYLLDLSLDQLDPHWLPTYLQCMPCHIHYSILGRIDTLQEDSKEILRRLKVKKQLPFTHVTQGKTSDQTVEKYYGELDRETLDRLYKMYEMDFLLFDYSPLSFYKYVQNSTNVLNE